MSVYVDDMYRYPIGQFGRMKMSHLMADSTDELLDMADRIGVARRWIQQAGQGRHREHFDIAKSKRDLAIREGAIEISYGQGLAKLIAHLKAGGRDFRPSEPDDIAEPDDPEQPSLL